MEYFKLTQLITYCKKYLYTPAGFAVCKGYVPEKVKQIEIAHNEQRIHVQKSVLSWGLAD